ncbi:MAG: hypothetical protein ACYTEM_07000, partial [Planctomycetota bacterium]
AFPGEGHRRIEESRIAELERKVGRQAMEIDFLLRLCSDPTRITPASNASNGLESDQPVCL